MSLARHAAAALLILAFIVIVSLLCGCVCTRSKTEDATTATTATTAVDAKTDKTRASDTSHTEGPVRTVTETTETTWTEAVCPGPTCPFPAEYWLPVATSGTAPEPPRNRPRRHVPGRSPDPGPVVVTERHVTVTVDRGPVVDTAHVATARVTDTMIAASSSAHTTDATADVKKTDVGLSWKAWLTIAAVLALVLYLGYRLLPKLPFLR